MPPADPSLPGVAASQAEPEPLRAQSLNASMTVKDLTASVAWYSDVVGFTIDRKMEREGKLFAVAVQAGDVTLLLNQDNGAKGMDRVKGAGISLMLTTTQDIDGIANRIRSKGGVLGTEPADMPWGARVFHLFDPDGYKLVISSPRLPNQGQAQGR